MADLWPLANAGLSLVFAAILWSVYWHSPHHECRIFRLGMLMLIAGLLNFAAVAVGLMHFDVAGGLKDAGLYLVMAMVAIRARQGRAPPVF